MTKHTTKTEITMTKGIAALIRQILRKTIQDRISANTALKRTIAELLGAHMLCKQETSHLILFLLIVSCGH